MTRNNYGLDNNVEQDDYFGFSVSDLAGDDLYDLPREPGRLSVEDVRDLDFESRWFYDSASN